MKTREEIFEQLRSNPVFYLATSENGKPHVRGMLLYKADSRGIIFHTGTFKALCHQIQENPSVEMCFNCKQTNEQIRISGELIQDYSPELMDEIYLHPTRGFLRSYGESIKEKIAIYRMETGKVSYWTMAKNLEPNSYIEF